MDPSPRRRPLYDRDPDGRSDLTKVWFPTWGAANGQDDLQWYQAVRQSNGDWSYTVNLSQHRDKGTYFIHVYGNTRQNLVAHTTAYVSWKGGTAPRREHPDQVLEIKL